MLNPLTTDLDRFRRRGLLTKAATAVVPFLAALLSTAFGQNGDSRLARQHQLLTDWASLTRYVSENTEIRPPKPGENRVVFLGDQITDEWGAPGNGPFFPGKPYINRGIGDET